MSGAVETIHSIINGILINCGQKPKRLLVPEILWVNAYLELNQLTRYGLEIATHRRPFDRFFLDEVEVRIE